MKICILTLGCKVNQYESGGIHKALCDKGYDVVENLENADVYIINTCAVTAEAERKSRNAVTKCLAHNAKAKIFVIGCASQKNSQQFLQKEEQKDNVVYLNGNANKKKVLQLIEQSQAEKSSTANLNAVEEIPKEFEDFVTVVNSRTRAFVKVQDGCDNFCSYCIVPYLRGRSRSREIQSAIDEIKNLKDCNEVVLTGINLSDYKFGGLSELSKEVDKVGMRFRFGSLEVNVITDEFLDTLSKLKHFCPQFHLSLQSGSTEVLKKMNRHYTAEEYLLACEKIKKVFPCANITTDVIVGFPTETEQNFIETCELSKKVQFGDMHIFPFSKRAGTQAEKFKDMPKAQKDGRAKILSQIRDELKKSYIEKFIGKTFVMLTEDKEDNLTVGHTENFIKVYIPDDMHSNTLVKVQIESVHMEQGKNAVLGALGKVIEVV